MNFYSCSNTKVDNKFKIIKNEKIIYLFENTLEKEIIDEVSNKFIKFA